MKHYHQLIYRQTWSTPFCSGIHVKQTQLKLRMKKPHHLWNWKGSIFFFFFNPTNLASHKTFQAQLFLNKKQNKAPSKITIQLNVIIYVCTIQLFSEIAAQQFIHTFFILNSISQLIHVTCALLHQIHAFSLHQTQCQVQENPKVCFSPFRILQSHKHLFFFQNSVKSLTWMMRQIEYIYI